MNFWEKTRAALLMANPNPESAMYLFGDAINEWIDDKNDPVSAADLQQMASQNRPILQEMLSKATPQVMATVRGMVRKIAQDTNRSIHYPLVIHRVSDKHPDHAAVLMVNLMWFVQQLDSTLLFLLQDGSAGAGGQQPLP